MVKDTNGKLVFGSICKLINDADGSNTITQGDKYQCKVKGNMEAGFEDGYYFYVLSNEKDGTTNLIMDRNICSDENTATESHICTTAWTSREYLEEHASHEDLDSGENLNIYGPVTAIACLNNATKDWNNIKNLNITYDDEVGNFEDFEITGKARLPYLSEAHDVGCGDYEDLTCPV